MNAALSDLVDEISSEDWLALDAFLAGDDGVDDRAEAVRLLCTLQAVVSRSGVTEFPSVAADCFCDERPEPANFINEGHSIRFIARATVDAIVAARQIDNPPTNSEGTP